MIRKLLVAWIALLGVTRVNLLAGGGEFILTPFLVLSPVVVALGIGSLVARGGSIRLPRKLDRFVLLVIALLAVILISAFLATDLEIAARRTVLLFGQIILATLGGLILANQPNPWRVLGQGAAVGILVAVFFNFLQLTYWLAGDWLPAAAAAVVSIEPGNYAAIIPRFTGGSHDPNIGGVGILCYVFLLSTFGESSRYRRWLMWAGVVCILLTLSRSALLAGATVLALSIFIRGDRRLVRKLAFAGAGAVVTLTLILLFVPSTMEPLGSAWELLGSRFSITEGSSREHAAVLARGWEVATYDLKHLLLGVGYGNAFTTLQDIFPGNRYGNFHSLFVTLLAESGIIAAALCVILIAYPLAIGGIYRPMIAGLLVFNLFQQMQTEPIFWLLLLFAWTGVGADLPHARVRRVSRPVAQAVTAHPSPMVAIDG
jgi:hypothetical protein